MKKILAFVLFTAIAAAAMVSCGGGKPEVFEVKSLKEYKDSQVGFAIRFPDGAYMAKTDGQTFIAASNKAVYERWTGQDMNTDGPGGGFIINVNVIKLEGPTAFDSIVKNRRRYGGKDTYTPVEKIKIDGVDGFKTTCKFEFSDGPMNCETYLATKDNQLATEILIEVFGGTMDQYRKYFDEIIANVKLSMMPGRDVIRIDSTIEQPQPSSNLSTYNGEGFSIKYPDNFQSSNQTIKNGKSVVFIGGRRKENTIRVDIIDAASTNLESVATQLSKVMNGAGAPASATLGSAAAKVVTWTPSKDAKAKTYIAIHNGKVYRVMISWYGAEAKDALPPLENSIKGFSFK